LAEVMNKKKETGRGVVRGVDSEVHKKEKENRKLQLELKAERQNLNSIIIKYQKELDDMQAMMVEENHLRQELQMALDSKDSDIEQLRCQLTSLSVHSLDTTSINSANDLEIADGFPDPRLEGWISLPSKNTKRFGWDKKILYANEGESKRDQEAVVESAPNERPSYISHKGHELIITLYHFPSSCEVCTRPLWNVFKPPTALECRCCHTKYHKDHLDKKEEIIAPCKGMILFF
ncbi:hypothetical protein GOODEAATRI_012104, partial [Goodea atripinnis]